MLFHFRSALICFSSSRGLIGNNLFDSQGRGKVSILQQEKKEEESLYCTFYSFCWGGGKCVYQILLNLLNSFSSHCLQEIKRLSVVLAHQEPFDSHKYAYIANVSVAKFARRQGIASNIIHLAADMAALEGILFQL